MINILAILIGIGMIHNSTITIQEMPASVFTMDIQEQEIHREAIYRILEETATKVAKSHEYKLHVFDCTQFSKELIARLKEQGFNARCMYGKLPNAEGYKLHTWVEVNYMDNIIEVESTGGFVISDEQFKEDYIIFSKGACL
jgi:hypothetical protein